MGTTPCPLCGQPVDTPPSAWAAVAAIATIAIFIIIVLLILRLT